VLVLVGVRLGALRCVDDVLEREGVNREDLSQPLEERGVPSDAADVDPRDGRAIVLQERDAIADGRQSLLDDDVLVVVDEEDLGGRAAVGDQRAGRGAWLGLGDDLAARGSIPRGASREEARARDAPLRARTHLARVGAAGGAHGRRPIQWRRRDFADTSIEAL
jgi:hypothetical protein